MPHLLPPTFPISWSKQVRTRKSDVCRTRQRRHSALQCPYSPRPNRRAAETYCRNRNVSMSTVMGNSGLIIKTLKQSGYSRKAWDSCYTLKDTHGRSQKQPFNSNLNPLSSAFLPDFGLHQAHHLAYTSCISKGPSTATEREEGICPETIRLKYSVT